MINQNPDAYGKPFHYLLSPSVFLDLDSFVYIVTVALLVFAVTRIVQRQKKKEKMGLVNFLGKYMIICSIPVFLLFFIQLAMSGQWSASNVIISVLPLVYGAIIQLIFMLVRKITRK